MDKTLNDRIEELFRGVVFVLFSFAASLALLLCNPLRGYALLIKRERVRSSGQIRPYAFLFFSFVLLFFMPVIIDALTPPVAGPFEYQVHDSDVLEAGALGRAYQATTERIETKAATAILLAAVVGVAAFHLGAVGSGVGLIRLRVRRETWRDALFFIGGLQFGLLGLAVILDRAGWRSATEMRFVSSLLLAPRDMFVGWGQLRPYPIYIDVLDVGLLALLLLAPFGLARRYAPRLAPRLGVRWSKQSNCVNVARIVFLMAVADLVALGSFSLAAYISDEVQPRDKPTYPFAMQYQDCTQREQSGKNVITGSVVVRAAAKDAWSFEAGDFELFLGATRAGSDGPPRAGSRAVGTGRIFAREKMLVSFTAVSPNFGSPPFLLQAGQAALIRFEIETPAGVAAFLTAHPDERRCTLAYTQDYPIGAIGILH